MFQTSSSPAPRARVLSNMYLPDAEGYSIRCFGEYIAPNTVFGSAGPSALRDKADSAKTPPENEATMKPRRES